MIDQIIDFNKSFVEQKGYEKYLTDKYPDKKLAGGTAIKQGGSRPTLLYQRMWWFAGLL